MNALLSAAAALSLLAPAPPRILDRVAASVNGDVVTLQDVIDRAGDEWRRADALSPGRARDEARTAALQRGFDAILADKLFESQLKALQIEVTDPEIDDAVENIKRAQKLDDRALDQALASEGLDRKSFREKVVRKQLETYKILNVKVRSRVKVSDDDVRNYYQLHRKDFAGEDEVHVLHIFLPLPEKASAAEEKRVRAEGEKVLQRLKTGEDFGKLAREVSKGPGADEGGDLGWIRRGTIQKSLEDVAFALEPGRISGLVRGGPGLHVFKLEQRRVGGGKTFEEVKDQIRDLLTNEQLDTYRQQYLAELKRDAVIQVNLPELKQETASAK